MTSRLRDMIRAVRACKTAAEERGVIAKECAALRNSFKDNEQDYRHRNVAKLMFIHMLGYPTHFGQMECLKLIASPGFPEKRIGYLGLMLLLDERQEVLMLVTNSLKNDLNHANQFITGLALCALGNICSAEMARDLAPEVEKLLNSSNSYVRKKAALCAIRIIRKVPDLVDFFILPATSLLTDKHHGVLLAGVKLTSVLTEASPGALEHFRKQTPTLVRVLKNLVVSGYAPEYDVGGITDPFLQIRTLRLLRRLGGGDADASDIMSDILAQVATNTEANKNAGNAILYECCNTIMGVEAIGGLRVLAVNILGRFLANRDNNIRYVALNTLVKVVAIDTQAVQRHRQTIVECVKDSDVSIRRRALELVYALVNEGNIRPLTKEMLEFLRVSDPDFKPDLTAKICSLVQRFSPNKMWHLDIMVRVLSEAGNFVSEDVIRLLIVLISNAPELQAYAARAFYRACLRGQWKGQESLALVAVWCVGEYGEMLTSQAGMLEGEQPVVVSENDVVTALANLFKDARASVAVRAYTLLALLKLTSRFASSAERIQQLIGQHRSSLVLELQQRSVEFSAILSRHQQIKASLVDKMPALDEATYRAKRADAALPTGAERSAVVEGALPRPQANGIANGPSKPQPAPPQAPQLADLLDFSVDGAPPSTPGALGGGPGSALMDMLGGTLALATIPPGGGPPPATTSASSGGGANLLLDLLSLGDSSSSASAAAPPSMLGLPQPSASSTGLMGNAGLLDPLSALTNPSPPSNLGGPGPSVPTNGAAAADPFGDFGFASQAAPPPPPQPAFPGIVALEKNGLKVCFDFVKPPGNPQATTVRATYSNSSPSQLTDFLFQAAVPKFMQLQLEPASGSVLPPFSNAGITQTIQVLNSMHGQKSLVMKLRISFKLNGQEVIEQGQVSQFPPGL
eukprot:TRINITY_DN3990_c1_g1_i1.p1 TRINITY_DN3990_c1_g1~~TRINITY_DN3990_c1_g1_i1.p1  ORF type:complete len:916 (+),score=200.04 TRINITY_DN3990_c1_g1_i1:218-2965(+)